MPLIEYVPKRFSAEHRAIIGVVNRLVEEYEAQGIDTNLRQIYYQFVARDLLPNTLQSYKRLGDILNDARLAGEIDWLAIEDRTRHMRGHAHWESPHDIVRSCASQFRFDKWADQPKRPEVWIEKDALLGVISGICGELDVNYFSCRGYTSQSEMWRAAQRLIEYIKAGQAPVVLHFGDHDPSGIDMSRDIQDRLNLFIEHEGLSPIEFKRLALNEDQIGRYKPPPNPAKITDSRARGYIAKFGRESWELDALEPKVLIALIRKHVQAARDENLWRAAEEREGGARRLLGVVAKQWNAITEKL